MIKSLLKIAKTQMFLSLFGVAVFAIAGNFSFLIILRYLAILAFTIGLEYLLWIVRGVKPFVPLASFVTATIVFLLSDPSTLILFPLLAIVFAVLQKQFIRFWDGHIFNPAGFGLFVSAYFGNLVSWWGPNIGILPLLATVFFAGYVSQIRVGQWKITIPFLITTVLLTFLRTGDVASSFAQLTVGAFLFFAFVMLPEPASAAKGNWTKPFYGISVAALPFILINVPLVSDLQLGALLIGNLLFKFIDRYFEVKTQPAVQKSAP